MNWSTGVHTRFFRLSKRSVHHPHTLALVTRYLLKNGDRLTLCFQLSKSVSTISTLVVTICNARGGLQIKPLQQRIVLTITYVQLRGFGLRHALCRAIVSKVQWHVLNEELLYQLIHQFWISCQAMAISLLPRFLNLPSEHRASAEHLDKEEIATGASNEAPQQPSKAV